MNEKIICVIFLVGIVIGHVCTNISRYLREDRKVNREIRRRMKGVPRAK